MIYRRVKNWIMTNQTNQFERLEVLEKLERTFEKLLTFIYDDVEKGSLYIARQIIETIHNKNKLNKTCFGAQRDRYWSCNFYKRKVDGRTR